MIILKTYKYYKIELLNLYQRIIVYKINKYFDNIKILII